MKRIILSVIAVITFVSITEAQFRVGIKAGANSSRQRVNVSEGNSLFSNDKFKSFHAGLITEFKIAENVYVQPQVLYTTKGATMLSSVGGADAQIRMNYIDVPVNVLYKVPVSFGKIFAGGGAAFSYGFAGKQEVEGHKTALFGSQRNWKREDISLSFTAGVEFHNGLFISANSQKGLLDVYRGDGVSVKNRSMSLSIGYLIDWKQLKKRNS